MAYCPSCSVEIAADSSSCPACGATFGPTSAWQPLERLSAARARRKPILAALSLLFPFMSCLGGYLYDRPSPSHISSGGWGIGELFIFVVIVSSGFILGSIANVIAL